MQVGAADLAALLGVPFDPTIEGGSFNGAPWMREFGDSSYLSGYSGGSSFPTTWLSADPNALLADIPLADLVALFPPVQFQTSVSSVTGGRGCRIFPRQFQEC